MTVTHESNNQVFFAHKHSTQRERERERGGTGGMRRCRSREGDLQRGGGGLTRVKLLARKARMRKGFSQSPPPGAGERVAPLLSSRSLPEETLLQEERCVLCLFLLGGFFGGGRVSCRLRTLVLGVESLLCGLLSFLCPPSLCAFQRKVCVCV